MKINKNSLIIPSLLSTILLNLPVEAQTSRKQVTRTTRTVKKQTVGDLLSQASRGGALDSNSQKAATSLPSSNLGFKAQQKAVNLESVKPPRSSEMMETRGNTDQAQYEKMLDKQISELYKLTQKFKSSPNRGELWLRLAELYVEKAGLVDARLQDDYDRRLKAFNDGKTKKKPTLNRIAAQEYNRKAVQLYEWFQRDFPKDPKMPQALFFLGYNYFELGDTNKGAAYYERLTREYPRSPFVGEAHFALAEYYFENDRWADAYKQYSTLIKNKTHRLHTFALYKGAWCLFRLGKVQQSISYLEFIIKSGKAATADDSSARNRVNRTRLEGEAMRDLVVFYAEGGDPQKAASYFRGLMGNNATPYLERLAYQYSDRGNKDASRDVFKYLISSNPTMPKAFEYQYQIVQNFYYAKNTTQFKAELYSWIKDYDKTSPWYAANKGNAELIQNATKLRETTLRNYVLQQHQTAQNSRAQFSQEQAHDGYKLYLQEFGDSSSAPDMRFYYAELLYDMKKYEEANVQYQWVLEHAPQSKFFTKAAQNMIITAEKMIPSDQEMAQRVEGRLDPIPLDPRAEKFVKSGEWFIAKFPQSEKATEIKFRVGRLYYQSNQFEKAEKIFKDIVKTAPTTKYAEYSANLLLDMYNLRKDYAGLEKTGSELLALPAIAQSKAGADIRDVVEKASFKKGQDLETQKKYGESGQAYMSFAKQNPSSKLATTAMFNAGVNFERAGDSAAAITAYQAIMDSKDPEATKFKPRSKRFLAKLYQDSANFEAAAKLYRESAKEDAKDPLAPNMMFNAAVLYEALGDHRNSIQSYNDFISMNKKASENIEAVFSIATMHRKAGQNAAAIEKYTQYVEQGGRSQEKVIESAYWVWELNKNRRAITKADEWAKKALAIQRRFAPNQKGVGAGFAAKIKLHQTQALFNEYKRIQFPANPARQKAAADKKISLLGQLNTELANVIKYDSAEEIVSALAILGEANDNMARTMMSAPLPAGLNAEETKQYQEGIKKIADPFQVKAVESFKLAVQRGHELEVYTPEYKKAYAYMNMQDPQSYYDGGEVGSDIKLINWMEQK